MYIFAYLRASTAEQDALRAKDTLKEFINSKNRRVASWYIENKSGASLKRPELLRLLHEAATGDAILVEQIDRLSRLDENDWNTLKKMMLEKELKIISLDVPTSHLALSDELISDPFTSIILKTVNNMLIEILAAVARKDYTDRRTRQSQGIKKAKKEGKYLGRPINEKAHQTIYKLRVENKLSIAETARLVGVSTRTVIRVCNKTK
jgi:DNA invertase Pin-like site-specific DNA recombinase